jgi:hypothetical protein
LLQPSGIWVGSSPWTCLDGHRGCARIRGTVLVTVEFRKTPRLVRLVDRVATVAALEALDKHRYRATFHLDPDHRGFGTLATLLEVVGGKRSTVLRVDGYPEMVVLVQAMARCARTFAYSSRRCEFPFAYAVPARCRACPLFDEERAEKLIAESFAHDPGARTE